MRGEGNRRAGPHTACSTLSPGLEVSASSAWSAGDELASVGEQLGGASERHPPPASQPGPFSFCEPGEHGGGNQIAGGHHVPVHRSDQGSLNGDVTSPPAGPSRRHAVGMILEHALLPVKPGEGSRFEAAFVEAKAIIASVAGFRRLSLSRCLEQPAMYLLLVEWA